MFIIDCNECNILNIKGKWGYVVIGFESVDSFVWFGWIWMVLGFFICLEFN